MADMKSPLEKAGLDGETEQFLLKFIEMLDEVAPGIDPPSEGRVLRLLLIALTAKLQELGMPKHQLAAALRGLAREL